MSSNTPAIPLPGSGTLYAAIGDYVRAKHLDYDNRRSNLSMDVAPAEVRLENPNEWLYGTYAAWENGGMEYHVLLDENTGRRWSVEGDSVEVIMPREQREHVPEITAETLGFGPFN